MASPTIPLFVLMCCLTFAVGTGKTKAYFPLSNASKYPRLRFAESLPVLGEFTFCSWIRIHNLTGRNPFIFSYATPVSDNEIAILLHTIERQFAARLHIGAPLIDFQCSMIDSTKNEDWNHLCVTWFSPSGKAEVLINGDRCRASTNTVVSPGGIVRSGGVAIVGQDQDAVGSKFDHTQAWYGDIADIHLWDEVLNQEQIVEAGRCGGKRKIGNVIAWMKTPLIAIDGAVFKETQLCQP